MIYIIHNSCQFFVFVIKLIINRAYFGLLKFRPTFTLFREYSLRHPELVSGSHKQAVRMYGAYLLVRC